MEARRAAGRENEEDDAEYKEMWNADAMGSLTQGAIISLKVSVAGRVFAVDFFVLHI